MATPHITSPDRPIPAFLPWRAGFLAALRTLGSVVRACEAAGVDRRWVYRVRASTEDFRAAWDDALAAYSDDLKAEAVRRAVDGVQKPVLYRGRVVFVWRDAAGAIVPEGTPGAMLGALLRSVYSDALLMRLLVAARPDEFGPRDRRVDDGRDAKATRAEAERTRQPSPEQVQAAIDRLTREPALP